VFTGIIEEVGAVVSVKRGRASSVLTIAGDKVLEDTRLGDSIAVNGVCLTVMARSGMSFSADVMHETLIRSTLGALKPKDSINLERAMPADGRFGGHIVSGHIDGCGTISEIRKDDNAIWYAIRADAGLMRYIVEKGSIAIDGISLTVATVSSQGFSVSIIPHTASMTTLSQRKVGDAVNLETDIIGKYVERLINFRGDTPTNSQPASTKTSTGKNTITTEFLMKNGF